MAEPQYDWEHEELLVEAMHALTQRSPDELDLANPLDAAMHDVLGHAHTTLHMMPGLVDGASFKRLCMDSGHEPHVWLVNDAVALARAIIATEDPS